MNRGRAMPGIDCLATKELELLQKAKRAFEEETGLRIECNELLQHNKNDICTDAALKIEVPGGKKKTMYAEIKTTLTQAVIGHLAEQIRRHKIQGVLIARYVTPQQAEKLKNLQVPFLDTAGNTYINDPPLFIYVTGKKIPAENRKVEKVRAFRPTGLQVVFALLCDPGLANAPYRDIAHTAKVALGTVGWVMQDLKRLGYMLDKGTYGRKIIHLEKLFTTWVETYARDLRPKIYVGRFTATEPLQLKNIDWQKLGVILGGEVAAGKIIGYLKPDTTTVYLPKNINANEFMLKHRLKKDAHGKIELLNTFWQFDYPWKFKGVTPPLLIYADLVATGNDRNIETARMIYDQYIARHIEQN